MGWISETIKMPFRCCWCACMFMTSTNVFLFYLASKPYKKPFTEKWNYCQKSRPPIRPLEWVNEYHPWRRFHLARFGFSSPSSLSQQSEENANFWHSFPSQATTAARTGFYMEFEYHFLQLVPMHWKIRACDGRQTGIKVWICCNIL